MESIGYFVLGAILGFQMIIFFQLCHVIGLLKEEKFNLNKKA